MSGFTDAHVEDLARQLEDHPDFRVLRRAPPLPPMPTDMTNLARGVVVDVETTGLDPRTDAIIQIAILPFAYAQPKVIDIDAYDRFSVRG